MLDELINPGPTPTINIGDRVTMVAFLTEDADPARYVEGTVVDTTESTATVAWDGNMHEQLAFWKRDLAHAPTDAPDTEAGAL